MSWACDHCGNLNATDGAPCESCGQPRTLAAPPVEVAPPVELAPAPPAFAPAEVGPPVAAAAPGRRGLPESIIAVVSAGSAYAAGFIGFFFALNSCLGSGSCSSNWDKARQDFTTSGWVSFAGNLLAILLGGVSLTRAPRGSGARTMGVLGLVLGIVGLLGSATLFSFASCK